MNASTKSQCVVTIVCFAALALTAATLFAPPLTIHTQPEVELDPEVPTADAVARRLVAKWPDQGMWLPDRGEVLFFKTSLDEVRDVLANALGNENPDVRQAAAYVIDEIGPEARHMGPSVMRQLRKEKNRLVRLYLYGTLRGIQFDDMDAINELRRRYSQLSDANVPEADDFSYAEVDEKITIASMLFALDSSNGRLDYISYIIRWLQPPPTNATPAALSGYAQRRLCAINCLEDVPTAPQVVPALKAMLAESNAENWVRIRVPQLLNKLQSHDGP